MNGVIFKNEIRAPMSMWSELTASNILFGMLAAVYPSVVWLSLIMLVAVWHK